VVREKIIANREGDKLVPLDGPIISLLPGTRHNDTHVTTFYRCQNCFNSTKLEIDFSSHDAPILLIRSSFIPDPIADPKAPLQLLKPDTNTSEALMDFNNARFDDYFSRVPPAIPLPCPTSDAEAPSASVDPSYDATSTSTTPEWDWPTHPAQGEL